MANCVGSMPGLKLCPMVWTLWTRDGAERSSRRVMTPQRGLPPEAPFWAEKGVGRRGSITRAFGEAFYSQILYELSRTRLCNFAVLLAAHAAPGAAPRVFRFAPTCPNLVPCCVLGRASARRSYVD